MTRRVALVALGLGLAACGPSPMQPDSVQVVKDTTGVCVLVEVHGRMVERCGTDSTSRNSLGGDT